MLEAVEEAILSYLNPALTYPATRSWPLVRFDEAVLTCGVSESNRIAAILDSIFNIL